jgi:hypothetical protein
MGPDRISKLFEGGVMSYPYTETLVSAKDMVEGYDYLFAGNQFMTTEKAIERFKENGNLCFRRGTQIFVEAEGQVYNATLWINDAYKFLAVDILRRFESR